MSRIWIKQGRILDPDSNRDEIVDLLLENGKIVDIAPRITPTSASPNEVFIDAKGLWVVPGLIDIHTHLRDPGFEYKEDIESGCLSASRGGFTSIVCMANTEPVNDNASVTEYILNKAKKFGKCRVFPVGAVTKGLKGKTLSEFGDLKESGVVALSDDGMPVCNPQLLRHALEYARNFDLPIISHCEDLQLSACGSMNEGKVSTELGISGIPHTSEEIMVARDIELADLSKGRLHLAHLSTLRSVRLLRQAKERGIQVTGEVTPHHIILTDEAVKGYDANFKMNPPLRTEEDRQEMIKGLKEGVFDAIASDHAPHSIDEKEVEFEKAPFGVIGFETTLPITLKLVHDGFLKPLDAIRLLTIGPAKTIGLEGGKIKKNGVGDITIIDPEQEIIIDREKMASKSKNTPFHGWKMHGQVRYTLINGEIIYDQKA